MKQFDMVEVVSESVLCLVSGNSCTSRERNRKCLWEEKNPTSPSWKAYDREK